MSRVVPHRSDAWWSSRVIWALALVGLVLWPHLYLTVWEHAVRVIDDLIGGGAY